MKKKLLCAAAVALACTAACAADVQIYGTISTAMQVQKNEGGKTSFTMNGGQNDDLSRIGLTTTESFGNGWYVKALLEKGFFSDTGATNILPQSASDGFTLGAMLYVGNEFFEAAAGHIGSLTSPYSSFSQYRRLRANAGRTYLSDFTPGGLSVNHRVLDNAVAFTTKAKQGFWVAGLYSNGDNNTTQFGGDQEANRDWSDRRHLYQAAVGFEHGPLITGFIYSHDQPLHTPGVVTKDATENLHYLLSYKFDTTVVSGMLFYAKNANAAFSNAVAGTYMTGSQLPSYAQSTEGLTVKAVALSTGTQVNKHFFASSLGYGKAEWKGLAAQGMTTDGSVWRAGVLYRYYCSKRTSVFAAAAYQHAEDLVKAAEHKTAVLGLTHRF